MFARWTPLFLCLLVLPTLPGCLESPAPASNEEARAGDRITYDYTASSDLVTQSGRFVVTLGSLEEMPEDEPLAPGQLVRSALVRTEWELSTADGSMNGTSELQLLLHDTTLSAVGSVNEVIALGLNHTAYARRLPFGSEGDVPFDLLLLPTQSLAKEKIGLRIAFQQEGNQVKIDARSTDHGLVVEGMQGRLADPEAVTWTAHYAPNTPYPTRYDVNVRTSAWLPAPYQDNSSFVVHADLVEFARGTGESITQEYPAQKLPSTEGPAAWTSLVTHDAPSIRMTLAEAEAEIDRLVPRHAEFVQEHDLTHPAFIKYSAIHVRPAKMVFEWNITFCAPSGSCSSAVVGTELLPFGIEQRYARDGGGASLGRESGGGFFRGPAYTDTARDLQTLPKSSFDGALMLHHSLNELPIRQIEYDPAAVRLHLESPTGQDIPVFTRPLLVASHGSITGREGTIPGDELLLSSARLVQSYFDAEHAAPILLHQLTDDAPAEWRRERPDDVPLP